MHPIFCTFGMPSRCSVSRCHRARMPWTPIHFFRNSPFHFLFHFHFLLLLLVLLFLSPTVMPFPLTPTMLPPPPPSAVHLTKRAPPVVYTLRLNIVLDTVTKENATQALANAAFFVQRCNRYLREVGTFSGFQFQIAPMFHTTRSTFDFATADKDVIPRVKAVMAAVVPLAQRQDAQVLLSVRKWDAHGGLATVGGYCDRQEAVGVVAKFWHRSRYSRNAFLHEVFHILGVDHDEKDTGHPECHHRFLMAGLVPHTRDVPLSTCTQTAMAKIVTSGRHKCLTPDAPTPPPPPTKVTPTPTPAVTRTPRSAEGFDRPTQPPTTPPPAPPAVKAPPSPPSPLPPSPPPTVIAPPAMKDKMHNNKEEKKSGYTMPSGTPIPMAHGAPPQRCPAHTT